MTDKENRARIDILAAQQTLPGAEMRALLETHSTEDAEHLFAHARRVRERMFGRAVWLRGLIEFSSYCRNDCYYCGLRRSNAAAERYRLTPEEIYACCAGGWALGFRTFVLQSGEDPWYNDARMCEIIAEIRHRWPGCAITLSLGERTRESYAAFREAGADRYLLRHESANAEHYALLHPPPQRLASRMACLQNLKELGYQVGCGFMVGSPGQGTEQLLADLAFLQSFRPQMVGIGPFLPHNGTPFAGEAPGTLAQTLFMLALVRLLLPGAMLPATTALGTMHPQGIAMGLRAGTNIIMPNLSPPEARRKYRLYENKNATGAEGLADLTRLVEEQGYFIEEARGDAVC